MEIQSITPELEEKGLRLDKVILNHMPDRSRTEIQKWIKAGQVIVNDNVEKANYKVEEEDVIQVTLPDPQSTEIRPEDIPLDIIYEDEDVIVVNKPTGMIVHPSAGIYSGTLVNALLYHCHDQLLMALQDQVLFIVSIKKQVDYSWSQKMTMPIVHYLNS